MSSTNSISNSSQEHLELKKLANKLLRRCLAKETVLVKAVALVLGQFKQLVATPMDPSRKDNKCQRKELSELGQLETIHLSDLQDPLTTLVTSKNT